MWLSLYEYVNDERYVQNEWDWKTSRVRKVLVDRHYSWPAEMTGVSFLAKYHYLQVNFMITSDYGGVFNLDNTNSVRIGVNAPRFNDIDGEIQEGFTVSDGEDSGVPGLFFDGNMTLYDLEEIASHKMCFQSISMTSADYDYMVDYHQDVRYVDSTHTSYLETMDEYMKHIYLEIDRPFKDNVTAVREYVQSIMGVINGFVSGDDRVPEWTPVRMLKECLRRYAEYTHADPGIFDNVGSGNGNSNPFE